MRRPILWVVLGTYLVYLAFTGVTTFQQWLKQRDAQKTVSDLRSAILMYQTEYKRFPSFPSVTSGADSVVTTSANDELMIALCPDLPVLAPHQSRRQIVYFSAAKARSESDPGFWRTPSGVHVRDAWGRFYVVYLDTDYDGKIEITYPDGSVEILPSIIVVRSLGRNGVIDHTPGHRDDDVMAQ